MRLAEFAIQNFRNYAEARLTFSRERNFFFGRNAQGKSNLLQAITLLCLSKDVRSSSDDELVKDGAAFFETSGTFVDERGLSIRAGIGLQKGGTKQIIYNGKKQQRQADYVGKFPIVVFSPESHRITSGPPSERRRFVDMLLCQGSPAYLADLQEYSRILRQRNAVLTAGSRNRDDQMLAVWDETLADAGARLANARALFFESIAESTRDIYRRVDEEKGELRLVYESQVAPGLNAKQDFAGLLKQKRAADWHRGQTTAGPHRDDVAIFIDGSDLRKFGSRGEHKSVLMTLKVLEAQFLLDKKNTNPIVVLDDLFSELDEGRARRCLASFSGISQMFVSSISAPQVEEKEGDAFFEIDDGRVVNTRRVE